MLDLRTTKGIDKPTQRLDYPGVAPSPAGKTMRFFRLRQQGILSTDFQNAVTDFAAVDPFPFFLGNAN